MSTFPRFLRLSLILLLVILVAWQTYYSVNKYFKFETVNTFATEYPKVQTFPTLSFCAFIIDEDLDYGSNDESLNWTFHDEVRNIAESPKYIINFEHNILDPTPLDFETDNKFIKQHVEAWSSHTYCMPFMHPNLTNCYTYTPIMNYSGGYDSEFSVWINASLIDILYVHLYTEDHGLLLSNPFFGLQTVKIKSGSKYEQYKISTTKNIVRTKNQLPCYEKSRKTHEGNLLTCVENWFQDEYGCVLPWNNNGSTKFEHDCGEHFYYLREYKHQFFTLLDSTPSELYENTGCYFDCNYLEFVPTLHTTEDLDEDVLGLSFFLAPSGVLVNKEVLAFDFYDLLGNIGGFLGLFLGASILSLYDSIRKTISSWLGKQQSLL